MIYIPVAGSSHSWLRSLTLLDVPLASGLIPNQTFMGPANSAFALGSHPPVVCPTTCPSENLSLEKLGTEPETLRHANPGLNLPPSDATLLLPKYALLG